MQALKWQGWVLQASTCSWSPAAHGFPPMEGIVAMCLSRFRWPPSQLQLHAPQVDQPPQEQSTTDKQSIRSPSHASTWDKSMVHPKLPSLGICVRSRCRNRWPAPQIALHLFQSDHSLTSQATSSHGLMLQPRVSTKLSSHSWPPLLAAALTSRCRCCWPPPHARSQGSHGDQAERLQSSTCKSHGLASFNAPMHKFPKYPGCCLTSRCRKLNRSSVQNPQSCQFSNRQGRSKPLHGCTAQGSISDKLASQVDPPPEARWSIPRLRPRKPPPQDRVQASHSDQGPTMHGEGGPSGGSQGCVSSSDPSQGLPPTEPWCKTLRLRKRCLGSTQSAGKSHSSQSRKVQS
mmetsp:Transcript_139273/g.445224  ORF Transcript_139273/g.445224 Transcript_139273/m.445224 type:complete len:346 (+) Transcript_139273:1235-2272(+)